MCGHLRAQVAAPFLRIARVRDEERQDLVRKTHGRKDQALLAELAGAFHRAHAERYGYADESREIELVAVRSAEIVPGPDIALAATSHDQVEGPVLVELEGATCWVAEGWHGKTNVDGTLVLRR